MKKPSKIIKTVYHAHIDNFGEPDLSFRYDHPPAISDLKSPLFVDVMVWRADEEVKITTFATIGMSEVEMPNVNYRVELHLSLEGDLTEELVSKVTIFLANLSLYPFMNSLTIDWWHSLNNVGVIPGFPSAKGVLFHSAFVEEGWDVICTQSGHVKILNVVPINQEEKSILNNNGIDNLLTHFYNNGTNLFEDRPSILPKISS